jgi:hypothetical protein
MTIFSTLKERKSSPFVFQGTALHDEKTPDKNKLISSRCFGFPYQAFDPSPVTYHLYIPE